MFISAAPKPYPAALGWDRTIVDDLRSRYRRSARQLSRSPRERLCFTTITIAAYVADLNGERANYIARARSDLERFKKDFAAALKATGSIDAKPSREGTRWIGSVECDLIDFEDYTTPNKEALIAGLADSEELGLFGTDPNRAIALFHVHLICDRRGHSPSKFAKALREMFSGSRRVHIASIYKTGTVERNLLNCANYATKFEWHHSTYEPIEETESDDGDHDQKMFRVRFTRNFHPSWKNWLQWFYLGVGLDDFIVSNMPGATHSRRTFSNEAETDDSLYFPGTSVSHDGPGKVGCVERSESEARVKR